MNTIRLSGCRPEPLLSYLKALGVFRLVAEQIDPEVRAFWQNDEFILYTSLTEAELTRFFEQTFIPTPIVAPWAGGSGFFRGDKVNAVEAVEVIAKSTNPRLSPYRQVITQVRVILKKSGQTEKPKGEVKESLLRLYRRELPDEFLVWMDSAIVLQNEGKKFPPLLGTGGNDGNFNFSLNLMQRLADLGFTDNELVSASTGWLQNALYGTPTDGLLKNAIGQFDPGRAGGPNATQGMDGDARVNPWEFLLMLEGSLMLAGSATRRLDANAVSKASFPFTVNSSAVGNGSLNERDDARGEIWLPLWGHPARVDEVRYIFSEGRAQLGKRQARNAVDFARAIAWLGVDRGLTGFARYGFLKRSGKSFLATSLGRFSTLTPPASTNLLSELDEWSDRFRRAVEGDNIPARFGTVFRRVEEAIFQYCHLGGASRFGEIIRALGSCERELSRNQDKPGTVGKFNIPPIPLLSPAWLTAAQEDSPEFRLALALAAMRDTGAVGELRTNLEGVIRKKWGWSWADPQNRPSVVWSDTGLSRNLQAVLERRVVDASRAALHILPLESALPASAEDIAEFLAHHTDDIHMEAWLWGLILINLSRAQFLDLLPVPNRELHEPLPRAYALLKLLFLPQYNALLGPDGLPIRSEPAILSHLRAQRLSDACQLAARRLQASGYISLPGPISGGGARAFDYSLPKPMLERLAAALLIPLSRPARIQPLVLRPSKALIVA